MVVVRPEDAIHRSNLYRLLVEIVDNKYLSQCLYFKGGTCATMLGFLDRLSIDLDFDLKKDTKIDEVRQELTKVFEKLGFGIKDQSQKWLQYILKYGNWENKRNSLKLEIVGEQYKANDYISEYLADIDRYAICQTIETMFANKLVALVDRYEKHNLIAGRDVYDIGYFFRQGYGIKKEVVEERRGVDYKKYLKFLIKFVKKEITETVLVQDLGMLLPNDKLGWVKKGLKSEVLMYLREEMKKK